MHLVSAATLERWNVLTDEQVVARVLAGQTALYELLIRRHHGRLYRTARALLRADRPADSALLQTFLSAYGRLREYDGTVAVAVWLTRLAAQQAGAQTLCARQPVPSRDDASAAGTRAPAPVFRSPRCCDGVLAAVLSRITACPP